MAGNLVCKFSNSILAQTAPHMFEHWWHTASFAEYQFLLWGGDFLHLELGSIFRGSPVIWKGHLAGYGVPMECSTCLSAASAFAGHFIGFVEVEI